MTNSAVEQAHDELLYTVSDAIGTITMNRPQARNALTFAQYAGIAKICREVPTDGSVKAIIIKGAGDKAFAAGTDMNQFRAFTKPEDSLNYEDTMDQVLGDVERCAVPTIAAIWGACTGGGAAIAAASDLRICDTRLKFGFPIARTLGNCLSIGNLNRMSALIGPARVKELIFTSRLVEAEEALALGLVSEVLDSPEAVEARAIELAQQMATYAPLTLRATKEVLRRLREDGPAAEDRDIVTATYMSADFKEGMDAFLNKRKPEWKGE